MAAIRDFFSIIHERLEQVEHSQAEAIQRAAKIVANTIQNDGIVYAFGSGHSHLVAEEICCRQGGLVPVDAILEPSLTGDPHMVKCGFVEELSGYAKVILDYWRVTPRDALLIISNSGRKVVSTELALECRERKIPCLAITCLAYGRETRSLHSSGKNLADLADVAIDNCGIVGDACVHIEGLEQPMGPTSLIVDAAIAHSIMITAAELLVSKGSKPPVFASGSLIGEANTAWEYNRVWMDKYWGRIRAW